MLILAPLGYASGGSIFRCAREKTAQPIGEQMFVRGSWFRQKIQRRFGMAKTSQDYETWPKSVSTPRAQDAGDAVEACGPFVTYPRRFRPRLFASGTA